MKKGRDLKSKCRGVENKGERNDRGQSPKGARREHGKDTAHASACAEEGMPHLRALHRCDQCGRFICIAIAYPYCNRRYLPGLMLSEEVWKGG